MLPKIKGLQINMINLMRDNKKNRDFVLSTVLQYEFLINLLIETVIMVAQDHFLGGHRTKSFVP